MSLSSALFSGISGLSTLGNSMTVIGDNIANVNTVGFKASRVTFQDVLSQTVATTAGSAQVGRGTSMADITSSFSQGSFESTDSTTDLAIGGEGFFVVRDAADEENQFYTRAGEFRFDKDGNFTNPAGYIVRGWALDEATGEDKGSITDIILQSFTSSPKSTSKLTLITNLDFDAISKIASLSNAWDGTATTNIAAANYEYQSTLKAYDSLGSTHDITIYYDKISGSDWEYIVTCNPYEDKRTGFPSTESSGLLARGAITFSEDSGAITNLTMDRLTGITGGHEQSAGTFAVTLDTDKGVNSTLTASDVSVAYNNQIALTEDGIVTMEFDQVPTTDQAITGAGSITTLVVNNDSALTTATGATKLTVTRTPIIENLSDTIAVETASVAINIPAEADETATGIILTWGGAAWAVTNDGGFTGGIQIGTVNNATQLDLQLGLSGTDDITVTVSGGGAGGVGDIVTFDIDGDNWRVSNVPAAYTLANGTDIGGTAAGVFELDLNGSGTDITVDTAGTAPGDAVSFHIKPLNWTCTAVPAAYTGLDVNDEITGTRTGYALDLGDPSGNDLTVSLAANAVEGDSVSFTIVSSDNWTAQITDSSGYFVFRPDFLGGTLTDTSMPVELDIGTHWDGTSFVPHSLASSQFARASTTTFQSADGYGAGDLQSVTVGTDGAITGQYSNGQVLPLYRVALAKFQNDQALFKVGGNLFRETRLSGDPTTSRPGTNGLGSISPNSLEQSNVDIATEFVKMITTQRGFQANSKIITVTDQMLAELINLKR